MKLPRSIIYSFAATGFVPAIDVYDAVQRQRRGWPRRVWPWPRGKVTTNQT